MVGHGLVLASGGRPGPILAVRPGGSGDVTSTHVAWQAPKGAPFVPSPLLYGDELYMLNDQASILTAYDAKSGTVLWQGRLGEVVQSGFSASPVAVDGKIFFTNEGARRSFAALRFAPTRAATPTTLTRVFPRSETRATRTRASGRLFGCAFRYSASTARMARSTFACESAAAYTGSPGT